MRKIYHVIDGLNIGGAQAILSSLCKYKKCYEHKVLVLSGKNEYAGKIDRYADVTILSVSKYNWIKIFIKLFVMVLQNRHSIFNGHLEASSLMLSVIRLFINFKLVLTIHAIPSQLPFWYNKIYAIMCRFNNYYIVEDKLASNYLMANKINPEKIKYIQIGTEVEFEIPTSKHNIKKEFSIPDNKIILLNVSRLIRPKGHKDLILMMDELKKQMLDIFFHLIIVGHGKEEYKLKKLARDLNIENLITFAGKRYDLQRFYSYSNWFLMPCYDESMGVVIYDAIANQIPVIAYNNGSISELIDSEKKGYIVNTDYKEMLDVIINNLPMKKLNLTKNELYIYSAERMADEYEKVYDLMI